MKIFVKVGWDEEITAVTGNKTYTAKYIATKNKYTIKSLCEYIREIILK